MQKVGVFWLDNSRRLSPQEWEALQLLVPEARHAYIQKFYKWQDRQAALYGQLLLREALRWMGYAHHHLDKFFLSDYKRPELPLPLDFNISHSGNTVVLAISWQRIGIDVEKLQPVTLRYFHSVLCEEEKVHLYSLKDPARDFCTIWTRKEAIIKAEGKGFYNELTSVNALNTPIRMAGRQWMIREVPLRENYICHLAAETELDLQMVTQLDLKETFFNERSTN